MMMITGRKVLVTGGTGFLGSHLVERLAALGADVTAADIEVTMRLEKLPAADMPITRCTLDLVSDDVEGFMVKGRFDAVFHLAASAHVAASVDNPRHDFESNVLATLNLLEAVRKVSPSTTILYTSSVVVYQGGGPELITEDDPTVPRSPYGVSKLAAERYINVYAHMYGMKTAIARLFSVFGPRLRKQIIYEMMGRLAKKPKTLTLRGSGKEMRDFTYVADVVDALLLICERSPMGGEAYNLASGRPVTVQDLARLIAETMGLSPEIRFSGATTSGDTSHWFANTQRINSLGYKPRVGLAEGLQHTVDWYMHDESCRAPFSA